MTRFEIIIKYAVFVLVVLLVSACGMSRFSFTGEYITVIPDNSKKADKGLVVVTSEYSEEVKKYLELLYADKELKLGGDGYIKPFEIDGKTPREASNGEFGGFTKFKNFYFELLPGVHSFKIFLFNKKLSVFRPIEISYDFEAGHEYYLGYISKYNKMGLFTAASLNYKYVLVDMTDIQDLTQNREGDAIMRKTMRTVDSIGYRITPARR